MLFKVFAIRQCRNNVLVEVVVGIMATLDFGPSGNKLIVFEELRDVADHLDVLFKQEDQGTPMAASIFLDRQPLTITLPTGRIRIVCSWA